MHVALVLAGLLALAVGFLPSRELRVQWWLEFGPTLVRGGLLAVAPLLWLGWRSARSVDSRSVHSAPSRSRAAMRASASRQRAYAAG